MGTAAELANYFRLRRDYGMPEDDIAETQEQAVIDYAAQLVRDDEVDVLVQELFDAGYTILSALDAQQKATGRAHDYDAKAVMRRIQAILKAVEGDA